MNHHLLFFCKCFLLIFLINVLMIDQVTSRPPRDYGQILTNIEESKYSILNGIDVKIYFEIYH